MTRDLVEVENQKGSGVTTGILEAGSTGAQTLAMVSNKVLSEILIPSWFLAASKPCQYRFDFCQLYPLGHLRSTPVAEPFVCPQWLHILSAGWMRK